MYLLGLQSTPMLVYQTAAQSQSDILAFDLFMGDTAVASVYFQTRPISPLDAAVKVMAVKVAGTRYRSAGCPSLVIALAANAIPNPTTYAACKCEKSSTLRCKLLHEKTVLQHARPSG